MRTPIPALVVFLACGAVWSVPPSPEVGRIHSVIENGGFEDGGALPTFWSRHPGKPQNRNAHQRDTSVSHSGKASGKLVWLDPIAGENKAWLQWMKYGLPVEGGSTLLVSGYVRTEATVPGSRVGIHLYDATGKHLGFWPINIPGPSLDWRPFEYDLPLPDKAAKMGLALYCRQGGATWYDDIAVIGTPTADAVRGTPRIDGRLDEALYTEERAITDFVVHTGDALPTEPTQAWLTNDDKALYVAFACPFPAGSELKLDATERDGTSWLDESVEVFIDPGHTHSQYVQYCVNAAGVVRDSRAQDASWNSNVHVATRRQKDRWTMEMAIPFAELPLPLTVGQTWGINLVRNDRVHGETSTWSLGGFHRPGRFGNVRLQANFIPFLAQALATAADAEQSAIERLRQDLTASGLPAATLAQVKLSLAQAETAVQELRTHVTGGLRNADDLALCQQQVAKARELRAGACELAVRHALVPPGSDLPVDVLIVDSARKILPHDTLAGVPIRRSVDLAAARDETESCQLAFRARQGGQRVSLDVPALTGPQGSLPIRWHRVGWVTTGKPKGYMSRATGRWPDVLLPPGTIEVPEGEFRTAWLGVDVPPDAKPGIYQGTVTVHCGDDSIDVPISLRVRSFRLPRPGTLACPFGIYASALSRWYFGTSDYAKHITPEQYAVWCEFLGRYRLTPKNVANEFLGKTPDGQGVDAEALATTLKPFVETLYPPASFGMYRLPCPRSWQTGTTTDDPEVQMARIRAKREAYLKLGLPNTAYIYGIDEPSPEGYQFVRDVYERTRQAAPDFPIMQTLNHRIPKELVGTVDIWCPLSARYDDGIDFYKERLAAGDRLWLYVCCGPKPPYANFFIDQEGATHRALFWQTWQARATGLLYWCVIWWDGLPNPTGEGKHFPATMPDYAHDLKTYKTFGVNGDGVLVWPGPDLTPWPSLRLEIVRDGIEDYEYLALLDRCIRAASVRQDIDGKLLEQARALLDVPPDISRTMKDYTHTVAPILHHRTQVADVIETLVARLGHQPPVR
jgi:hypothetical protein